MYKLGTNSSQHKNHEPLYSAADSSIVGSSGVPFRIQITVNRPGIFEIRMRVQITGIYDFILEASMQPLAPVPALKI